MTHLARIARWLRAMKRPAFSRARVSLLCAAIILCSGTAVGSIQKCLAQPSKKLGVSYSTPDKDNFQAAVNNLGPVAWHYDWASSDRLTTSAGSLFVPMIQLLPNFNAQELASVKRYGSTLLVGSEPPDPPQAWIAAWPQAQATKMRLGMPAGNDGWKAEFLREANARGYRVDFLCLHPYPDAGVPPNPVQAANGLISYVQQWHSRYNKPIWLTEFALPPWGNPHTAEDNLAFMQNVLPRLEALPYVEKYCWWTTDWPYSSSYACALANHDGTLTPQGVFYANFAKTPTSIPLAEGNYYLVPQNATRSRLDAGGGTANGTGTDIRPVNGGRNQCWTFTSMGGSSYEIQPSYDTSLALEVASGSSANGSANGTVADLHTANGGSNQLWTATRLRGNVYTFSPQNAPGSCLEVSGGTANGASVAIRQASGGKNQQWALVSPALTGAAVAATLGCPPYYLSKAKVGLTVTAGTLPVGASYYTVDGGPAQTYSGTFTVSGDGAHKINYWSMDTSGNKGAVGTQSFSIDTSAPLISSGNHTLTPQNAPGSRLAASASGTANGTVVDIQGASSGAHQLWTFAYLGGGQYEIQPSYANTGISGLGLDVYKGNVANGTLVSLSSASALSGWSNQIWTAIRVRGNVYTFSPQNAPGSCLEVSGGTANGTGVDIRQASGGINQQWAIN